MVSYNRSAPTLDPDGIRVPNGRPQQIWKLIPVRGEPDTYYIQNLNLPGRYVIEPLDTRSGGTLVMSKLTRSDLQKWRIGKTKPAASTNLSVTGFKWYPGYYPWQNDEIRGTITWNNPGRTQLAYQIVRIKADNEDGKSQEIESWKESYKFNWNSTRAAKYQEHCFTIVAVSKWEADNIASSTPACFTPDNDDSNPPPPPPDGYSKLTVYNCHSEGRAVRLWTYDRTVNNGSWTDHGTLASNWQDSDCERRTPAEITLTDQHIYDFVAIDCGNSPPDQENASCRRLSSPPIRGNSSGGSLPLWVN